MSLFTQAARVLFPVQRSERRGQARGGPSLMAQIVPLGCALLPLGAMVHAYLVTA